MTEQTKTNRTQLTDLPVAEQELTGQEMAQVQGGASNLNLSKSNINLAPAPGTPGGSITTAPPLGGKTYDQKTNEKG